MPRAPGLCAALVALGLVSALARGEEASVTVRAGDSATGTLRRCGEYHVVEFELLEREAFRVDVTPETGAEGSISTRVFAPDGEEITDRVRMRWQAGVLRIGAFRARTSGLHRVQLTTYDAHGLRYGVASRVFRRRRQTVRLGRRRDAAMFRATPGATLTLKSHRGRAHLALTTPDGARLEFAEGDAALTALAADGLAVAGAGLYRVERLDGARALTFTLRTPRPGPPGTVEFPAVLENVAPRNSWYWSGAWIQSEPVTETYGAPVHPGPPPQAPRTPTLAATTSAAPRDPYLLDDVTLCDATRAGVGLPFAGVPTLAEVVELGRPAPEGDGVVYAYARDVAGLGAVEFRARFAVDGRGSAAPLDWGGRVSLRWTTSSADGSLSGDWTLAFDESRGVETLTGRATWFDAQHRQLTTRATAYSPGSATVAPSGTLAYGVIDPRGDSFLRSETYDGANAVIVGVTSDGVASDPVEHTVR